MNKPPCKRFRLIKGRIVFSKTFAEWDRRQEKKHTKAFVSAAILVMVGMI